LNDRSYFYERAEIELERAQRAAHPGAVKAHYLLAGYYLDRVYGGEDAAAFGGEGEEVHGDAR
jgi:hypothetical protein